MRTVSEALRRRITVRAFLPTPLPRALVHEILDVARWSPSGGNTQCWRVVAVAGAERDAVVALAHRTMAEAAASGADEAGAYPIYPPNLWEPYRSRRFKVGEDMYATMGIERGDRARRLQHVARNLELFGAPVGLFFVIDRRLGYGQWAHLGMFMQSVALVAEERGLGSCFQESWASVRESLRRHFGLPATDVVYCGMALGFPDPQAPVNRLRSERAAVEEFADLRGFD